MAAPVLVPPLIEYEHVFVWRPLPTSSSTPIRPSASWTVPRPRMRWPPGRPSWGTPPWRSRITTGCADRSSSPTPPGRRGCGPSPGPRSPCAGGAHLTLLAEDARGVRQPLPAPHPGPRGHPPSARPPPAPPPSTAPPSRPTPRGWCASPAARAGLVPRLVAGGRRREAEEAVRDLVRDLGAGNVFVEIQHPRSRGDRRLARDLARLAASAGVPCVATGDPHAHSPERALVQDAFVAIRHRLTLDGSEAERRGNRDAVLRSPAEMAALFADHPEAVAQTTRLADRLRFDLTRDLGYRFPDFARIAPRRDGPGGAGARLRLPARRALPQRRQAGGRPGAPGRGARAHRPPRPGRLLPAAPRHPGAGAGGGAARAPRRLGPPLAAAGAGPRIVRGLDRLLPHRPVPHRPGRERALPGAVPQPRHGLGARHRPRLPARRPRAAHRGGHRPLRHRARRPGRRLPHLPHPHGHPRARRRSRSPRPTWSGWCGSPTAGRRPRRGGGAGAPSRRPGQAGVAALAGAGVPRPRGRRAAPTPVTALRWDGRQRPAAGGAGAGGSRRIPGPTDLSVGQGLLRRRRLREDRPARPGDALGGGGVRRPHRPRAARASTCRASGSPTRRSTPRSRTPTRSGCSRSRAGPRCRACCRPGPRTWTTSRSRWRSSVPGRSAAGRSTPT